MLLLIALLFVVAPVQAQVVEGCFDVSVGEWNPIEGTQQIPGPPAGPPAPGLRGSGLFTLPSRVELVVAPGTDYWEGRIVVPDDGLDVPHAFRGWGMRGDTLVLHLSTGFAGTRTTLLPEGYGWSGPSKTFSDNIGEQLYSRTAALTPADCGTPSPIPASAEPELPRTLHFIDGRTVTVGDTVPAELGAEPRESRGLAVRGELSGLWAGADSIVLFPVPDGRIEEIRLYYPLDGSFEAVRERMLDDYGSRDGSPVWQSRTTSIVIARYGDLPFGLVRIFDRRVDFRNR